MYNWINKCGPSKFRDPMITTASKTKNCNFLQNNDNIISFNLDKTKCKKYIEEWKTQCINLNDKLLENLTYYQGPDTHNRQLKWAPTSRWALLKTPTHACSGCSCKTSRERPLPRRINRILLANGLSHIELIKYCDHDFERWALANTESFKTLGI